MPTRRRLALVGVLVFVAVIAAVILREVVGTVFFAVTVAYVLYPVRERLADRGLSARVASTLASLVGLLSILVVLVPPVLVLYQRRTLLFALLREIPASVTVELVGTAYVVETETVLAGLRGALTGVAVDVARAAPVLALKLFLFAFVVYGLLLAPLQVREATFDLVPAAYHDLVQAFHERVRDTLYAIYVLQAATAFTTFVVAAVVFAALGYGSWFSLAVIAGILQFVPVVGPSFLVVAMAAYDLALGEPTRALLLLAFGLVVVGFLPDAVVRPRLAARTADIPASVYFIGFTGGVLTVGAVGFIAGPLVVALLLEAVERVSVR